MHIGCALAGTSSAVCASTFMAVLDGVSTNDSGFPATSTYTELVSLTVPITSGAQILLASQTGCSSPASTAASATDTTGTTTDSTSSTSTSTSTGTTTAQGLATSHRASKLDTAILFVLSLTAILSFSLGIFL